MTPEFSRPQRLDQLGPGEFVVEVAAKPAERAALAQRFGLLAIDRLEARFALRRDPAGVTSTGHLSAAITQACVVTGEPCAATLEEEFALRFLPEGSESAEDVELSGDALDTMFFAGSAIDLGEAAAETMALTLDPFPRSPAATEALAAAGIKSEDQVGKEPGKFAALAGLRDKLAGKP